MLSVHSNQLHTLVSLSSISVCFLPLPRSSLLPSPLILNRAQREPSSLLKHCIFGWFLLNSPFSARAPHCQPHHHTPYKVPGVFPIFTTKAPGTATSCWWVPTQSSHSYRNSSSAELKGHCSPCIPGVAKHPKKKGVTASSPTHPRLRVWTKGVRLWWLWSPGGARDCSRTADGIRGQNWGKEAEAMENLQLSVRAEQRNWRLQPITTQLPIWIAISHQYRTFKAA